jgi:type IX secretion system PorP/SprF family membrane protein
MRGKLLILLSAFFIAGFSQQLPYYTQYRAGSVYLNPAAAGTKRIVDLRMNYRTQWVGFEDAPKTQTVSLNGRFLKGTMGGGFMMFKDQTGPTKRSFYNLSYSYHIRYPDVELSMGASANMMNYTIDGSLINTRNNQDYAILYNTISRDKVYDASVGVLLYNDRFHVGLSFLNIVQSRAKFYEGISDSLKESTLKMFVHPFVTLGYTWSGDGRIIFENTLQSNYVPGTVLMLDYSLRVYFGEMIFGGLNIRLRDAICPSIGMTIANDFQVSYAYDIGISKLRGGHSNTHEIMLIYSSNLESIFGKHYGDKGFKKQKFQYMF